jgi:hypothetical protein
MESVEKKPCFSRKKVLLQKRGNFPDSMSIYRLSIVEPIYSSDMVNSVELSMPARGDYLSTFRRNGGWSRLALKLFFSSPSEFNTQISTGGGEIEIQEDGKKKPFIPKTKRKSLWNWYLVSGSILTIADL